VSNYVNCFAQEKNSLTFLPEKEFETLIEFDDGDGGALVLEPLILFIVMILQELLWLTLNPDCRIPIGSRLWMKMK